MKKHIILFSILVLGCYTIFEFTSVASGFEFKSSVSEVNGKYIITLPISKGWNLLPTNTNSYWDVKELSEDVKKNLKYSFVYLPVHKQYVSSYGGFDSKTLDLYSQNTEFLKLSSEWYYFSVAGEIKYEIIKNFLPSKIKLHAGWNLFSITPDFYNNKLGFDNCNIEKIYLWEPSGQKWIEIDDSPSTSAADKFVEEAKEDFTGLGAAIKVSEECSLEEVAVVVTPPSYPGRN